MKAITTGKKRLLALSIAAAMVMGGCVFAAPITANAYTVDDVASLDPPIAPSTRTVMDHQGWRTEGGIVDPYFEDTTSVMPRTNYGGPWSFTHVSELPGNADHFDWDTMTPDEQGAQTMAEYSSVEYVTIEGETPEGMRRMGGVGDKITTGLKIKINGENKDTLSNSLTYSQIDDMMYGPYTETDAYYFTMWVKPAQDMWFDVGISYGAAEGQAQVYWDMGRRFKAPANQWTQIGVDKEGHYLPFRTKVTEDQWKRGTGSDPTAQNSNCVEAPDETKGDTQVGKWYRAGVNGADGTTETAWACLRIYAYDDSCYTEADGHGIPAATDKMSAGDSYIVTGANWWCTSEPAAVATVAVTDVTLDKTSASLKVGETLQLNATVAPANATDSSIMWYAENETVVSVDDSGKVTALKEGTTKVYAEANDGNGAIAECSITVTKAASTTPGGTEPGGTEPGGTEPGGTTEEPKEDGGCGSFIGFGSLGILAVAVITVSLVLVVRKKEN